MTSKIFKIRLLLPFLLLAIPSNVIAAVPTPVDPVPAILYKVTFNPTGGTLVASKTVPANTTVTAPPDPSKLGHTFGGWYREATFATPWNFSTDVVTAATTLYAKWKITSYKVSFESNAGSPVPSTTVAYGHTVTEPPAPTKVGYDFAGWYAEAKLKTKWAFHHFQITGPTKLYAKWEVKILKVTFNSNGGSIEPNRTVYYGTKLYTPKTQLKSGYIFQGWYKDEALTTPWKFDTDVVTVPTTLYAKWKPAKYKVTLKANGGSNREGQPKSAKLLS
jgi:uncharacterized repeat protein (TIGR02543 family)